MSEASLTLPTADRSRPRGAAPAVGAGYELVQRVLYIAGAVLIPLGIVVIVFGWYGAARTPYQYDQISYLVSGGVLGLGLTFAGGFLYFGAWLARIAADQRESDRRLGDTLLVLADAVSHAPAQAGDAGSVLVTAGEGTVVHRADCALVSGRADVEPVGRHIDGRKPCRICGGGQ